MCEELIGEVTACREQRQNTGGVARCHILPEAFVPFCFLLCLLCITVCLGNKWDRGVVAVVYRLDKESNYDLGRRVSAICIRVILRCWGNSSLVCQQKSDAL